MVNMVINRKSFYIRHITDKNGIFTYSEPTKIYINLYPANGKQDLYGLGEDYTEYMKARLPINESLSYSVQDLIYDKLPEYADELDIGNAVYIIDAILPVLNVTEIRCRRCSGSETGA